MTGDVIRVSPDWLALREPADAAARARDLAARLEPELPAAGRWLIHDLGAGSGSMGRWLAPLLPGRQHWILHDRDADLLKVAAAHPPGPAADGTEVTVEARRSDIIRLDPGDLAGATLVTASALLDMLTEAELADLVRVCAGPGCPILITLSVVGRVLMTPEDPLDGRVTAAFNAHQRRETERGRLLGPDAVKRAAARFGARGAEVLVRPSPWRLGAWNPGLTAEWLTGWVRAAREQQADLTAELDGYTERRLAEANGGRLSVIVDHADLLVLPARTPPSSS
ncbi:MAG TPA: hypothetical protein VHW96_04310 [Solirubrobacteraceae bacterium]|jgi:hypothetical protein|nr:hypothetical protein [Solirubrobacteraceae bacterium]